ncbi:fungal-specific transcription factor domain-containing protein [Mycena galericulata]|nr:fungal-specific transcription factor domain-containing protein [Mycena galericulata]
MAWDEDSSPPAFTSRTLPRQRRQQRSCDACRHRKIRCDGLPGGQCSNCLAFGCPCTYVKPTRPRGPKTELVQDLRHQIATLEAKLRTVSICSLCAQPLESRPDQPVSSASVFQQSTPDAASTNTDPPHDNSVDELADRFLSISIGLKRKFFGSASTFALLTHATAVKEEYLGGASTDSSPARTVAHWELLPWEQEFYDQRPYYVYPATDLIASLLELYFINVHPTLPILHRPSFERSVVEGLYLKDPKFGAMLLAVLAVASRYSNDPRVLVNGNTLSSGWKFVAQIQIVPQYFEPNIDEVQFYCLMTLFTLGTSARQNQLSWLYLGIGVRCLQHRGAHRPPKRSEGQTFEDELWNRAFWSFFMLDGLVTSFLGRPPAIHVEHYDVEPPLEVDDEYWEEGFTQPLGKPSQLSYFVHCVRLWEIVGDALRRLYASKKWKTLMGWTGPEWEQGAVAELDSAMNDFLDSIPLHLRWEPDKSGVFLDQSALLYISYYYIQIVIHRPFAHKATALAAPSLSICISAARSALHIADIWMTRVQQLPSAFVHTPVFVSAIILLMNIFGSKRAGLSIDHTKDLAQVGKAREILKFSGSRWQSSGRSCDLLQELQSLNSFRPRNDLHCGPGGVVEPHMVFASSSPTSTESAGNLVPPANFSEVAAEQLFEPGTSIEQLLADVTAPDTSAAENGWNTEPVNGALDDELMSMWMAVPTDFTDMTQWDAYIKNMNTPTT